MAPSSLRPGQPADVRALVGDPVEYRPTVYRRFVRRVQIEGLIPDHLVLGEPYLALNAVVVPNDEIDALQNLTSLFARVFDRAGRELASDPVALENLGFPWTAAELLGAEEPRLPVVGRFDFVQDRSDRWWLLEYNADTPSGIREAIVADAAVARFVPAGRDLSRPNRRLKSALTEAVAVALRDLPAGSRLGLLTSVGELEDLAQMAYTQRVLAAALAERGISVVLGDLDNLQSGRRGLTLCGQPINALYRYVPLEYMLGTPAFALIYDAVLAGRLLLLNGLFGLLLQNKGLLAWIWEHRDDALFPADERLAIERHLPPTRMIGQVSPTEELEDQVVKQVFGREGAEVYFGADLDNSTWTTLRAQRTFVVQRRVDLATFDCVIPTSTGPEVTGGRATIGAYALAGEFGGFYTRVGGKIITNQAKWFATYGECRSTRNG